jgi:hypothetical protein
MTIYTRCHLTYGSDKLVALSGVAKIMAQVLDDEYCGSLEELPNYRAYLDPQTGCITGNVTFHRLRYISGTVLVLGMSGWCHNSLQTLGTNLTYASG